MTAAISVALAITGMLLATPAYAVGATSAPAGALHVSQAGQCTPAGCLIPEARQTFEDFFSRLMQIPDRVLRQGDNATREWIRENTGSERQVSRTADPVGCAGAVAATMGGILVPAAKILKIKGLIKELGGVAKSVRLLIGAGSAAEKTEAIATAVGALGAELLGIKGIRDNCFR